MKSLASAARLVPFHTMSTSHSMPQFKLISALCSLRHRWRFCNRELRLHGRLSRIPSSTGFGIFSDILPGSVADLIGVNPPYDKTFQGGLLGTVGGTAIAPGVPNSAVDATVTANQIFTSGFPQGQLSCASPQVNPNACRPP